MSTDLHAQIGGEVLALAGSLGQGQPYRDAIQTGVRAAVRLARDPKTPSTLLLAVGVGTIVVALAGALDATRDSSQLRSSGVALLHRDADGR